MIHLLNDKIIIRRRGVHLDDFETAPLIRAICDWVMLILASRGMYRISHAI